MKILAYTLTFLAFVWPALAHADGETVKCSQPDGKTVYQNWPCGTKPPIERPLQPQGKHPDYPKIVDCAMRSSFVNVLRSATGQNPLPSNCAEPRQNP